MIPPNINPQQYKDAKIKSWKSRHETFTQSGIKHFLDIWNVNPEQSTKDGYKTTTLAIQALIAEAIAENKTLRALGGSWSFSKAAATDGIMLNTKPLNYMFAVDQQDLHASFQGKAGNLFFCQCGTNIARLNRVLLSKGKALPTSGASNGQTIAGALSTGTHGSAFQFGAIPEYVVALHIITGPNESYWLEREKRAIVSDAYAKNFASKIERDTELFNAALVSFGSFGIIHGVMIEARDNYYLTSERLQLPLDAALWKAITTLDLSDLMTAVNKAGTTRTIANMHHFEVVVNPFDGTDNAYVTLMHEDAQRPAGIPQPEPHGNIARGDSTLGVIGALLDMVPKLTPDVVNLLFRNVYKEHPPFCGTRGQIFGDTTTRGVSFSAGLGIPVSRVQEALTEAKAIIKKDKAPIVLGMRFVKASQGTLSFTYHSPYTCIFETDGPKSQKVITCTEKIWKRFSEIGIPYTFHWGKCNNLDKTNVRKMYGDERIADWLAARKKLLSTSQLRQVFSNEFLVNLDLHG